MDVCTKTTLNSTFHFRSSQRYRCVFGESALKAPVFSVYLETLSSLKGHEGVCEGAIFLVQVEIHLTSHKVVPIEIQF